MQNPNIKIVPMQMDGYSSPTSGVLITKFANSVSGFLSEWYNKCDPQTGASLRVNGYNVDYEWGDTLQTWTPTVLSQIRLKLDALGATINAPRFQVSITPATILYLDGQMSLVLDYINMQNYDGGYGTGIQDYLSAITGLKTSQLTWGKTSEMP